MLIGSHYNALRSRVNLLGGGPAAASITMLQSGRMLGLHSHTDELDARPVGYSHPNAYVLARKAGGMGATYSVAGSAALALNLAGGRNAEADLSGSGAISDAPLQLVVSAVATLAGSGTITDASALAYLNAAATLAGSGALSAAVDALGHLAAAVDASAALSATPRALGNIAAEITPFTELSPQSLADAVWASEQGRFLYALGRNKVVTDPIAGTYTVYDADDTTILYTADLWQNAAGTVPYAGSGAERRDRLT